MSGRYVRPGPLDVSHVTLSDGRLRLEPFVDAHLPDLLALFDPEIWRWYSVRMASEADLEHFLRELLREPGALPYAARNMETGELVGCTAFRRIVVEDRRVEIGSTWWARKWQRTFVNSAAKRLMLSHAFERMGALAVELRTDALNVRSRRAIERLGARYSGCLPAHRICYDGRSRDTVIYTITDLDWQRLKAGPSRMPGVRFARNDDVPALADMRCQLWPDASAAEHEADARCWIEGRTGAVLPYATLVAEEGGAIVGFADIALRSHAEDCDVAQPTGFVEGWFVRPEHRRRGVGRRLIAAGEAWAKQQGAKEMASNTWADHTQSIAAHRALDFEQLEAIVSFKKVIA